MYSKTSTTYCAKPASVYERRGNLIDKKVESRKNKEERSEEIILRTKDMRREVQGRGRDR